MKFKKLQTYRQLINGTLNSCVLSLRFTSSQHFCHACFWCVCSLPVYLLCLYLCLYFAIIFILLDSFLNFVFNGRIIASHCCVGFHQTSTWISHRFIRVPSHLNIPPTANIFWICLIRTSGLFIHASTLFLRFWTIFTIVTLPFFFR